MGINYNKNDGVFRFVLVLFLLIILIFSGIAAFRSFDGELSKNNNRHRNDWDKNRDEIASKTLEKQYGDPILFKRLQNEVDEAEIDRLILLENKDRAYVGKPSSPEGTSVEEMEDVLLVQWPWEFKNEVHGNCDQDIRVLERYSYSDFSFLSSRTLGGSDVTISTMPKEFSLKGASCSDVPLPRGDMVNDLRGIKLGQTSLVILKKFKLQISYYDDEDDEGEFFRGRQEERENEEEQGRDARNSKKPSSSSSSSTKNNDALPSEVNSIDTLELTRMLRCSPEASMLSNLGYTRVILPALESDATTRLLYLTGLNNLDLGSCVTILDEYRAIYDRLLTNDDKKELYILPFSLVSHFYYHTQITESELDRIRSQGGASFSETFSEPFSEHSTRSSVSNEENPQQEPERYSALESENNLVRDEEWLEREESEKNKNSIDSDNNLDVYRIKEGLNFKSLQIHGLEFYQANYPLLTDAWILTRQYYKKKQVRRYIDCLFSEENNLKLSGVTHVEKYPILQKLNYA